MRAVPLCAVLAVTQGCTTAPRSYSLADFAALSKIDVHVHLNSADPALVDEARVDGFRLLTINADYPDFPPLAEQRALARAFTSAHPDWVAFAATFSMEGWDDPGWQRRVLRELDNAFAQGAVAVKVWKNIGMAFRDQSGKLVMIDDAKFDAIFARFRATARVTTSASCWR
jgi:hypothetical protein